nr:multiubiquitin domain-containing protein [Micromonospora sp. DSM 115978]
MTVQDQAAEIVGRRQDYVIVVNGTLAGVDLPNVSYEQVVEIAFPGPDDPNVTYSVAFRNAEGRPGSGLLVAGRFVEAKKKGTSFS